MILVTGATGFIGQAARAELQRRELKHRAAVRRLPPGATAEMVAVGEMDGSTDWHAAVLGADAVIHIAGRAHVFGSGAGDIEEFRRVNVHGTESLATAAAAAGVRRFVLLSSVKVNGDVSDRVPFCETDEPHPIGAYALSKWEAEQRLRDVGERTGLSITIVRTPLVYGPGVKANFLSLLRAIDRRLPLPFGRVRNARSLIFVDNLVDALLQCAQHQAADGELFLVKDGLDLSTPDLVRRLAAALGRRPRLVDIPPAMIAWPAKLIGHGDVAERVLGSLVVDSRRIGERTGWTPPYSVDAGLAATASWYRASISPA